MSTVKIRCKCEMDGVCYNGIAVMDGVNIEVNDACDPSLGKMVSFTRGEGREPIAEAPIVPIVAIKSVSISYGIPASFLVLSAGE